MNTTLSQFGGMIRYEMLMQFRRRAIIVLCVFFLVGALGLTTLIDSQRSVVNRIASVRFDGDTTIITTIDARTQEEYEQHVDNTQNFIPRWYAEVDFLVVQSTFEAFNVLAPSLMILLIAIMPMLSETIPLDRQFKVRELLDTMPLPRVTYLLGKLVSVWIGLMIGIVVVGVLYGIYVASRYGALDMWTYVRYWLFLMLPCSLIGAGYAVIVPTFAQSRRGGVLVGLFLIPLGVYIAITVIAGTYINNVFFNRNNVGELNLGYQDLVARMFSDTFTAFVPFIPLLLIVGIVMWAFLRFRAAR